jgi:hypothetical protein
VKQGRAAESGENQGKEQGRAGLRADGKGRIRQGGGGGGGGTTSAATFRDQQREVRRDVFKISKQKKEALAYDGIALYDIPGTCSPFDPLVKISSAFAPTSEVWAMVGLHNRQFLSTGADREDLMSTKQFGNGEKDATSQADESSAWRRAPDNGSRGGGSSSSLLFFLTSFLSLSFSSSSASYLFYFSISYSIFFSFSPSPSPSS